jgi:predicted HicB family RNase H-like nuclease
MNTFEAATERSEGNDEEMQSFSGRFPVRLPRYLHRYLSEVAHEQGVSLNQFV